MVSTDRVAECEYEIFFFGIHDKNADITWSLIIWDYLITLDDEVRPYCILLPYISSVLTVLAHYNSRMKLAALCKSLILLRLQGIRPKVLHRQPSQSAEKDNHKEGVQY